jgi:hypothetical protein
MKKEIIVYAQAYIDLFHWFDTILVEKTILNYYFFRFNCL